MHRSVMICVAFCTALAFSAQAKIDPATLVGAWTLDEGKGAAFKDASGNNNNGEVVGAKWVDGKDGKALEFDGSNHARIPASPTTDDYRDGFTYALWVKPTAVPGNPNTRVMERNWHNPTIQIGATDFYASVVQGGGIGNGIRGGIHKVGSWTFVALTHDGKTLKLYVDGELVNQSDVGQPDMTRDADGGSIWFAQWKGGPGWDFKGAVDEVSVHNAPLPDANIKDLMKGGLKGILAVSPAGRMAATWGSLKR